ncbi:hypothetical protein [Bacteroides acidifaciens]|uniref:hypothetical protein n=1 Tax=Bacteroides acidifaciens TaxID=85831 RepID=UPI00271468A0|nr:hypothetical protein [Bacteroides acidifaciens]
MKPKRQIEVSKQVREMLVKEFNTTSVSVWRALSFRDNSPKSKRIRCAAYQNRGVLLMLTPAMETIHDADNFMRQYFPNGVLIEANKNNSHVDLLKNGEVVKSWDKVYLSDLDGIQQEAVKLCGTHVIL